MMRAAVCVLTAVVVLVFAASSDARLVLVTPTGERSWRDSQLEMVRAATPDEAVVIVEGLCPAAGEGLSRAGRLGCTHPSGPVIWIEPAAPRSVLRHEVGHRVDYAMSDTARRQFLNITGQTGRPWRTTPDSPHEQFAEAWRLCAVNPVRLARWRSGGYGYWPSLGTHRRVCRVIEREAARQGWNGIVPS